MPSPTTRIREISLVCLTTPDQDRAVEFYEKLGFKKRTDTPFGGGYRWIEMYPPQGTTGIALAPPPPAEPPGFVASRFGFMAGEFTVPDDIKTPFKEEIEAMFYGDDDAG